MFIGIDYGEYRHAVCVLDDGGQIVMEREVRHGGCELEELAAELRGLGGGPMRLGIERSTGALVETFVCLGFDVYAINPKQLDRWRQFSTGSDAKDDRRDAHAIADALRARPEAFRQVVRGDLSGRVRALLSLKADLVQSQVAATNRLTGLLRPLLPGVLELAKPRYQWGREVLEHLVSVKNPARIRLATLTKSMRMARKVTPQQLLDKLHADKRLFTTASWQGAATAARCALEQLNLFINQLQAVRRELAGVVEDQLGELGEHAQRDAELVQSMPGAGPNLLAALVAYSWDAIAQRDRQPIRCLGGVAPLTHQSGGRRRPTTTEVRQRRACNNILRSALYDWGRVAVAFDTTAKKRYAELRARGHTHGRAIRQLVDGLLQVMVSMLRSQQPYRPAEEQVAA